VLASLRDYVSGLGFVSGSRIEATGREYVDKLRIKTPSTAQLVKNLSGGNQQKVVIGKWLATRPKVIILDEPTKGIDIGSKAAVHGFISELAAEGLSIIMVSSELPEILGMSDRVLVMRRGRLRGEFTRAEATSEKLLRAASDA
jgi:ribose transport system ATP-binding protein